MLDVEYMFESTCVPLRVRADDQGDAAMGVDVVGAVLGVVFQHEDGRLRPELAVADRFDDATQRQVVVGQISDRRCRVRLAPSCDRWGGERS